MAIAKTWILIHSQPHFILYFILMFFFLSKTCNLFYFHHESIVEELSTVDPWGTFCDTGVDWMTVVIKHCLWLVNLVHVTFVVIICIVLREGDIFSYQQLMSSTLDFVSVIFIPRYTTPEKINTLINLRHVHVSSTKIVTITAFFCNIWWQWSRRSVQVIIWWYVFVACCYENVLFCKKDTLENDSQSVEDDFERKS